MERNGCRSITVQLLTSMILLRNERRPLYSERYDEVYEQLGISWSTSSNGRSNKRSAELSSRKNVNESYPPPHISCVSDTGLNYGDIKGGNGETPTETYDWINKNSEGASPSPCAEQLSISNNSVQCVSWSDVPTRRTTLCSPMHFSLSSRYLIVKAKQHWVTLV